MKRMYVSFLFIVFVLSLNGCGSGGNDTPSGGTTTLTPTALKFTSEGSGATNVETLHPLKRGQTYGYVGEYVAGNQYTIARVGETFEREGRALVRITSGAADGSRYTQQESWVHEDENGLWLDGSPEDGLLEEPLLMVPATVRDGMRWEQTFSFKGNTVTLVGLIEKGDQNEREGLWHVYRQQRIEGETEIKEPTRTPYVEGVGPWDMVFLPTNPPVTDVVETPETFSNVVRRSGAPIIEKVDIQESDAKSLSGFIDITEPTEDRSDPFQLVRYLDQFRYSVANDLNTKTKLEVNEGTTYTNPETSAIYTVPLTHRKTMNKPFSCEFNFYCIEKDYDDFAYLGGETWQLLDRSALTKNIFHNADQPTKRQWTTAYGDGTVDLQRVEEGKVVNRRLGKFDVQESERLSSAWVRADGSLEGVIVTEEPVSEIRTISNGTADWVQTEMPEGQVLPHLPWVDFVRRGVDFEVCWNSDGASSNWTLDGFAPAAIIPTMPSCVLLVRNWSYQDLDFDNYQWALPTIKGEIEGIGTFTLKEPQAAPVYAYNRNDVTDWSSSWMKQEDGKIMAVEGDPVYWYRRGGIPAGTVEWSEYCEPDAKAGCWYTEAIGGSEYRLNFLSEIGPVEINTSRFSDFTPVPAGGVVQYAEFMGDATKRNWFHPDGTVTPFTWTLSSDAIFGHSFDGVSACSRERNVTNNMVQNDYIECRDIDTGTVRFQLKGYFTDVYPLENNRLLLWPDYGEEDVYIVDRTSWTATKVDGSLHNAHFGGELSDGTLWAWRPHPDDPYNDRQMIKIEKDNMVYAYDYPISIEKRKAFGSTRFTYISSDTNYMKYTLKADDDLVYWTYTRFSPGIESMVIRVPWSKMVWVERL